MLEVCGPRRRLFGIGCCALRDGAHIYNRFVDLPGLVFDKGLIQFLQTLMHQDLGPYLPKESLNLGISY
jgi:hypothetical protein